MSGLTLAEARILRNVAAGHGPLVQDPRTIARLHGRGLIARDDGGHWHLTATGTTITTLLENTR